MAKIPLQISREKDRDTSLEYASLRAEALTLVQELSGHVWTDYNLHDPGVTMLEQLCFSLTDLAYKTDFPVQELLADENGRINATDNAFFSKADILSSGPVTVSDYRKLILDQLDEVENIWIEPVLSKYSPGAAKGTYRVFIQPNDKLTREIEVRQSVANELVAAVRHCLMRYRSIGENFEEITVLKPQHISIRATIMVDPRHPVRETLAYICNAIEHVVHPPVRFMSEGELLEAGYATEDIYQGPLLTRGFVPDEDLLDRKKQIDPSEMVKAVSHVTGVLQVKYLHVSTDGVNFSSRPALIQRGCYPYIDIADPRNDIGIYSDQFEQHSRDAIFWNVYQKIREVKKRHYTGQERSLPEHSLESVYRDTSRYYSLQHYFPAFYGLGNDEISRHETPQRRAKAKQLKAYLLFFEQILANYLAQLGNLPAIFSPDINKGPASTYFTQPLYDVPHVKHLLKAFTSGKQSWEEFTSDPDNAYLQSLREMAEHDDLYQQRKIRIFDHLLARFNLVISRYPVSLYEVLYQPPGEKERITYELKWKASILQHLPALLSERTQGFNYQLYTPGRGINSGFQQWLYKLMHIDRKLNEPLTAVFNREHVDMKVSGWRPVPQSRHLHADGETVWYSDDIPDSDIGTDKYYFGHQPVSLLKHGIDPVHYKIVEDPSTQLFIVLYKAPGQNTWHAAAKHPSKQAAIQAQRRMIRHLQEISEGSEGFYIVEHTLMKPLLTTNAYGFKLLGKGGKLLLEQRVYQTYQDREETVSRLIETDWDQFSADDMYQQLLPFCIVYTTQSGLAKDMAEISNSLRQIAGGTFADYPRIDFYIDSGNGQVLPDTFYRPAITVVLPCWPARFQYEEFRRFTKDLIREQTPVYFNVHYRWLNIADMRQFESIYYPWLEALPDFYTRGIMPPQRSMMLEFLTKNRRP